MIHSLISPNPQTPTFFFSLLKHMEILVSEAKSYLESFKREMVCAKSM